MVTDNIYKPRSEVISLPKILKVNNSIIMVKIVRFKPRCKVINLLKIYRSIFFEHGRAYFDVKL